MSSTTIQEHLLNLTFDEVEVLLWSCRLKNPHLVYPFINKTLDGINYHLKKIYKTFDFLFVEEVEKSKKEGKELSSTKKRGILLEAVNDDLEELLEPLNIKKQEDFTDEKWDEIVLNKRLELLQTGKKPKPIDPPPRRWELLLIQINGLIERIPEGFPRIVAAGLGMGVIVILLIWILSMIWPTEPTPVPPTEAVEIVQIPPQTPPEEEPLQEVPQEVPPIPPNTDTPTHTPTITHTPTTTQTPTNTPTSTITPTPTIAPTDIEVGPDNLPLTFEGTYKVPSYYPFDMKLYLEERSGDRVSGKFQWPDRNNRFQGWEGIIVHDFGDVIEHSKWEQVEGFGSEGTYIKETRKWVISAGGGTDGNYYFYISPEGRLTGVWFRHDDLTPEATIDLYFSE